MTLWREKKLLNKIISFFVLVLFFFTSFLVTVPEVPAGRQNWIIGGDKVYYEDSLVYLSSEPHTLTSSGWVNFEIRTKVGGSQKVDLFWGFNLNEARPMHPQIWLNYQHQEKHWHDVEIWNQKTYYGFHNPVPLDIADYDNYTVDFGTENNIFLYQFDCYLSPLKEYEKEGLVVAFTNWNVEGEDATVYGYDMVRRQYIDYQTYPDWWDIPAEVFTVIELPFQGMTHWFLAENVTVNQDFTYKIRAWIEVPFAGFKTINSKYWWGIKPHAMGIREADMAGLFYRLDPWMSGHWDYRKEFYINSSLVDEDLVDFPFLLTITNDTDLKNTSKVQADGDDIVFTDLSGNKLPHEISSFDQSSGNLTVYIKSNLSSTVDTGFHMYYGNANASNQEDVAGVWYDYAGVWHLDETSGNIAEDFTAVKDNGTVYGNVTLGGVGVVGTGYQFNGDSATGYVNVSNSDEFNFTADEFSIEIWVHVEYCPYTQWRTPIGKGDAGWGDWCLAINKDDGWALFRTSNKTGGGTWVGHYGTPQYFMEEWVYLVGNFNNTHATLYLMNTTTEEFLVKSFAFTGGVLFQDTPVRMGVLELTSSYMNSTIDEPKICKKARSMAWFNLSMKMILDQDDMITNMSEEETSPYPEQPLPFTATAVNYTQIDLSWTKGLRADYTHVRWSTTSYPTLITDGNLCCNITGTSFEHTGRTDGVTYYYSAWGYNTTAGLFSSNYSIASATTPRIIFTFTDEYPSDGSTDVEVYPILSIQVNQSDGKPFNLTWYLEPNGYANSVIATMSNLNNGTYAVNLSTLGVAEYGFYNWEYDWYVVANNFTATDLYSSSVYEFETETYNYTQVGVDITMNLWLIIIWLIVWGICMAINIKARSTTFGIFAGLWLFMLGLSIIISGVQVETGTITTTISPGQSYEQIQWSSAVYPFSTYSFVWGVPFMCLALYIGYANVIARRRPT